jgi:hypothetical protein
MTPEAPSTDVVVAQLSAAVREHTAAGDPRAAALACVQLGDVFANQLGNAIAGRAWFARATRLVQDEPPCVEQGWAALGAMGCDVGDPALLLARADLALELARRFGDVNLETKALADGGLALVSSGRIAEGMARLDEAMALACGPADDRWTSAKSACSLFTACYYALDFDRAASWGDLLRQHGVLSPHGSTVMLSNHCDTVRALLLCELGRWTEAEELLARAQSDYEAVLPGFTSWHPAILLADLRIRQGRLVDAEQLLLGRDVAFEALLPAARLHLARGDHDLARAAATRGLRALAGDHLRAVELLTTLVEVELAVGAAARAAAELTERIEEAGLVTLQIRAAAPRARVQAALGSAADAVAVLEEALARVDPGSPWLRLTLLVELARQRASAGDAAGARLDAEAAAGALAQLDVVLPAADVELLRSLARHASPADDAARLHRDGRWWTVSLGATSVRLADTKGLRYLAELVASPGRERHALDLVDLVEGVGRDGPARRALGDAGPVLDAAARTAYRRRIEELRAECDEALAAENPDRAEALAAELDLLVVQLAQAFGLGGRDRRAASAVERARLNVTRAIRSAIAKLLEALPEAGATLDRGVRTGTYCRYERLDGDPPWIVHT